MTLFVVLAAALAAGALAFLLPPLLRARGGAEPARADANAGIYREQLEELAAELGRGAISQAEFERSSREIERRIVAENAGAAPAPAAPRRALGAALALAVLVPVAAGLGYWQLGEPRALDPEAASQIAPQQLEALATRLEARLGAEPDDGEGWALLGRARFMLEQFEPAAQAFGRALALAPEDRELLRETLMAMAMAGHQKFDRGDYRGAIAFWEQILIFAPPDSEVAKTVRESIAEAQAKAGAAPAAAAVKPAAKPAAPGAAIQGVVALDPALAGKAAPGDTVFVLARAASGPRMPLAVARTTVAELPYRFTLDDSMAMAPGATISAQERVIVAARISKSGQAAPQKGDIEGASAPVAPGAKDVRVVLSRIVD